MGVFNVKTYIKLYGPHILEALESLVEVAKNFAKKHPGIRYFHYFSLYRPLAPPFRPVERVTELKATVVEDELISKSGWSLGDYDFYFEWERKPGFEESMELIELIDDALARVNCEYTIATK